MSVPDKIIEYIQTKELVSIEDVAQKHQISKTTAMNYLSRLSSLGIVNRVGYGLYQYGAPGKISIPVTPETKNIADLLGKFGEKNLRIWSLSMLSNYFHYTIGKDLIFIETNTTLKRSIRDMLIQNNYQAIIDPTKRDFKDYSLTNKEPVFIIDRKEKYGLSSDDPKIPTPERMWVDLYYYVTRKELSFSPYELGTILGNMIESNIISYDRMLYYSNRRKIRDEIVIILYEAFKKIERESSLNVIFKGKGTVEKVNEIIEGVPK